MISGSVDFSQENVRGATEGFTPCPADRAREILMPNDAPIDPLSCLFVVLLWIFAWAIAIKVGIVAWHWAIHR